MQKRRKKVLLTGCAGFIGSNFVKKITCMPSVKDQYSFHIIDALTYAGKFSSIEDEIRSNHHLRFTHMDIRDKKALLSLFETEDFDGIIHFAAESHVDRSIKNPALFLETNILGTQNLLEMALHSTKNGNPDFRYLQISTDEVYGSLDETANAFTEQSILQPNSPYSASKASADLLVRSYVHTFHLNAVITRCSNNYGPYQFPEKFIPVTILKALKDEPIPIYGNGMNIRDWIHVDDHNLGVWKVFLAGKRGEVYNLGGNNELRNIDVAKAILTKLNKPFSLLEFVEDRLGHDFRYAIDYSKSSQELSWNPQIEFSTGLDRTIQWYQDHYFNIYNMGSSLVQSPVDISRV